MKLKKDPESGVYHAEFKDRTGKTRSRTTHATTLDAAKKAVADAKVVEIEAAALAGTLTAETLMAIIASRKVTCESALKEWADWRAKIAAPSTVRDQQYSINAMFTMHEAHAWPVTKLDFDHIDAYVNAPDAGTRGNRESRLAAVRVFFQFITARAYRLDDPSALVRVRLKEMTHEQKEVKPRVPFTDKEVRQILDATEGFWHWATSLSYWAGLRLSDIATLEWASILPDEIVVWTRKGGVRVALPIDDPLIGAGALRSTFIDMMDYGRHPRYVFPKEREMALDPDRRAALSVYFSRILVRDLDITGKSFHCLRHSFATRLEKAGKTVEEIGRMIGHAKSSTASGVTAGYIHKK